MSATTAALKNPAITVAIGTVTLFVIARIAAEFFYRRLGFSPEDAGFNSVQVLLQGVSTVFVISLLAGGFSLLAGVVYGMVMVRLGPAMEMRLLRRKKRSGARSTNAQMIFGSPRRILRLVPLLTIVLTLFFACLFLVVGSIGEAKRIRRGDALDSYFGPWPAKRVTVTWIDGSDPLPWPDPVHRSTPCESPGLVCGEYRS